MKISIKKVVGVVLIGLGVYALYRFLVGEEGAVSYTHLTLPTKRIV